MRETQEIAKSHVAKLVHFSRIQWRIQDFVRERHDEDGVKKRGSGGRG
jgi:hypothetical protein